MIAYADLHSGLIGFALSSSRTPPNSVTIVVSSHQMLEEAIIYCGVARKDPEGNLAPHVPGFEEPLSSSSKIAAIATFARKVRDQLRSMPAKGGPR